VPVDFLTPEQRARYGRYGEDPTPEQLGRCFHLTNDDRELIDKGQSDRARLGCAVQLGTVRFLGTFLADQTDVPTVVVDHLAAQLGIADPSALKGYGETAMRFKHAAAIRNAPATATSMTSQVTGGSSAGSTPVPTSPASATSSSSTCPPSAWLRPRSCCRRRRRWSA